MFKELFELAESLNKVLPKLMEEVESKLPEDEKSKVKEEFAKKKEELGKVLKSVNNFSNSFNPPK